MLVICFTALGSIVLSSKKTQACQTLFTRSAKIYIYSGHVCQVYKHKFVMIINKISGNQEMCRLDHFQNDRDVLMHDMLLYFPRVDQTNERTVCQKRLEVVGALQTTMPKFERDSFKYEFQVSDDLEIYDVHGFFCKFHFYVELLMHDNHKENAKVHVKSLTKFHWTHLFQDYCFHNNKSNETD